jgi:ATP-dependent HslUV protease ATP-binding subunit HslU
MEMAIKQMREQEMLKVRHLAEDQAEERILDELLRPARAAAVPDDENTLINREESATRQRFRKMLREGKLNDREVEMEVSSPQAHMEIFAPPGMEELTSQIQGMFQNLGSGRKRSRKLKIREARQLLVEEEALKMVNDEELKIRAVQNVEQNGIVFLDEIDKITSRSEGAGSDVSRQGVQRDLLPLVEGTTVSTRYGMIKTDHILFIASGAFHLSKPSDLMPELQGRLPIRVELHSLSVKDFEQILTNTDACLTRQYQALLKTEGVDLVFESAAIGKMAQIAHEVNEKTENIGARRLYTVMEKLLEDISFRAGQTASEKIVVDAAYVETHLAGLAQNEDLARYVL